MKIFGFGEYMLEPQDNTISKAGESTALSPRVMEVLMYLVDHLKVASRTSTFQLAEEGANLAAIADELDVHYVLEGSVQQFGDELRITSQLVRAKDNFHVWSRTYEGKLSNRMQLQESTAKNIAFFAHSKMGSDIYWQHPELFKEYQGIKPEAVAYFLQSQEEYSSFVIGEGDLATARRLLLAELNQIQSGERPTILRTVSRVLIDQGAYHRALENIDEGLALVSKGASRGIFLLMRSQALKGLGKDAEASATLEEKLDSKVKHTKAYKAAN